MSTERQVELYQQGVDTLLQEIDRLGEYENVVLSIAGSLPCELCEGTGLDWQTLADRYTGKCTDCHGTGHPDPATVAAGLPGAIDVLRWIAEYSSMVNTEQQPVLKAREALSALSKPKEPS